MLHWVLVQPWCRGKQGALDTAGDRAVGLRQEEMEGETWRCLLHQDLTMVGMLQPTVSPPFNQ